MRLTVGGPFFPPRIRNPWVQYGIAVAAIAIVVILTVGLWVPLGKAVPVALVFFAIAVTSWYAGRNAGIAAALLGMAAVVTADVIGTKVPNPWANVFVYLRLFAFT